MLTQKAQKGLTLQVIYQQDEHSTGLPNLQKRCTTIRSRNGLPNAFLGDSHVSRQNPTFHLKNRRTFALFTPSSAEKVVIWLNVRRNLPQSSNFWLNVRSSNKLSRLYCPGGGRYETMSGNLYCVFSTEKYSVIRKRGRQVEVLSNIHPKKLGVNVRRYGPQPSIFVRSFSQITRRRATRLRDDVGPRHARSCPPRW
jgi:hypothetical protein